jgi:hypothetical protein
MRKIPRRPIDDKVIEDNWTQVTSNRSGRVIRPPAQLIEEMNSIAIENYYSVLENGDDDNVNEEFTLVGAGIGVLDSM